MKLKIITTNGNHDIKLDFWNKKKDEKDENHVKRRKSDKD